jgi:hypothetical protein
MFLALLAVKVAMAALQPSLTQTVMAFLTPMMIVRTHEWEPQLELTVVKSTRLMAPSTTAQMMETRPQVATQQHLMATPAMALRMGQQMELGTTPMSLMSNPIQPSLGCRL